MHFHQNPKLAKLTRNAPYVSSRYEVIDTPKQCLKHIREEFTEIRDRRRKTHPNDDISACDKNPLKMSADEMILLMNGKGVFSYQYEVLEKTPKTPKERLNEIQEFFDFKHKVLAKAMNISTQAVKNKLSNSEVDKLSHNNVDDVLIYINKVSQEIKSIDIHFLKI